MSLITGLTRGGKAWTPAFVTAVNEETCIGCGRCFKVCPRNVFDLEEREPDDDDDSDDVRSVMVIADASDCIGCGSCARVCPKNCHTHEPQALLA
ncbi:ferredoxin III, nif-specific [Marinospirillum alkaliphilum]|uniref:Ferredoxin III n=1 Tax=Marinospirillum alkaliphilum DSM 21637 TaxID=1122209 RepID=A0A1K1TL68_9GAMM|nr:ferredoxin III, nif-specific [Marinospirillum alkaliphilum]SFX01286.1 ferredoxin III, nif-specific [Marinospirillum alkaliphilum DSM 21637]